MLPPVYLRISPRRVSKCLDTFRYVRSIARRRPPVDSIQTLKGKVKTECESQLDNAFAYARTLKDVKRMGQQVFVNTDELETEAEDDFENDNEAAFEHAEKFYDMNLQEEKAYKRMVKKNIVKNKYFKAPQETNLLTYAAKMQIRHLRQLDPAKWTPETLAESFPVSVDGVKKLLKNNYRINDAKKIKQHDAYVVENWKLLESGNTETISPVTVQLYKEGKINKDHHASNFPLPPPPPVMEENLLESKPKEIGEHASMIKYYVDLKKKSDVKEVSLASKDVGDLKLADDKSGNLLQVEQRDLQRAILPEFKFHYPTRAEMESMQSASYLAAEEPDPHEIEIPQSQFEENLLQELAEKNPKSRSSVDVAYEEWLQKQVSEKSGVSSKKPQPFDSSDFFEAVKKYNGDSIELSVEKGGAFLYDEHLGYQQPLEKDVIQRRIKIPKEKYVPGALYKVGKKFYADDGVFLFKVFV